MFGIAKIEHAHAVFARACPHRFDEGLAFGICVLIPPRGGGRRVVERGECQVGPTHLAACGLEFLERMRRMQFVKNMPVDEQEVAPVQSRADEMRVPDLVE